MAILSGYYNSLNGDRKYNAETMSRYFAGLFTRGVLQNYEGKFVVKASTGMNVIVQTGKAFFSDGKWIENTADITIEIDPADVVLGRIDSIVLQNDKNEGTRKADVVYKKGTPSANPVAPGMIDNEYIEEMRLCNIRIEKNTENITQSAITNTIPDTAQCGYVTGMIQQVDTGDLYLQYEAAYEEFKNESQQEFDEWFENIKQTMTAALAISRYRKVYTTTQDNEQKIPIGIEQHDSYMDILDVYVSGLRLNENEYTEEGLTHVNLTLPVDKGTVIEFVVLKGSGKEE